VSDECGPNLATLAQSRQVIGVDLQGHGRTSLGDREFSLVDMGNDMAGVLKKLGYDKVDVLGYSLGGGVAFQFATQHPEMVRRLALASILFSRDGFYPEILAQQAAIGAAMAEHMKETPMYKSYVAIAPHPEDFPKSADGRHCSAVPERPRPRQELGRAGEREVDRFTPVAIAVGPNQC
jgi:pimeloyl-ACP methyl ester carboxylesterase